MHCGDFGRIDAVFVDHGGACEVAHCDDMVGVEHSVTLDIEYCGVDIAAGTVEICGVDMDHKRFSCDLLGVDSGRIRQPVVGVDDVEIKRAGYHSRCDGVIVDLFQQIVRIASGEFNTAEIICTHIVEVGIYMVAQSEIEVGIHDIAYSLLHIVAAHVAPCDRNL